MWRTCSANPPCIFVCRRTFLLRRGFSLENRVSSAATGLNWPIIGEIYCYRIENRLIRRGLSPVLSAGSDTPQGDDDEVIQPVTVPGQHVVDSLGQRVKGCVVAQTHDAVPHDMSVLDGDG